MSRHEYESWYQARAWSPSPASGLVIESDLAPAAWIEPLLHAGSFEVDMTVPQGFESYARILFPFASIETAGTVTGQQQVTWTETARRNERVAHALMEQETILLPGQEATCLTELAASHPHPVHRLRAQLVSAVVWLWWPQPARIRATAQGEASYAGVLPAERGARRIREPAG
jgi:hypothetical protein